LVHVLLELQQQLSLGAAGVGQAAASIGHGLLAVALHLLQVRLVTP
jgi:hypothetical protein